MPIKVMSCKEGLDEKPDKNPLNVYKIESNLFILHEYKGKLESVCQELTAVKKELKSSHLREYALLEKIEVMSLLLLTKQQKKISMNLHSKSTTL